MNKLPKFKTVKSKALAGINLFHISFKNKTFQGMWNPDNPAGFDESEESSPGVVGDSSFPYPEPSFARISCSPTIEQCFRAVYPNVADMFKKKKYPYMEYSVFAPIFNGREDIILPEELTKQRMVWDACVTDEHCIMDTVQMFYTGQIRVFNTNNSPIMHIHPFNDPKNPLESVGPATIKWEWVHGPY